MVDDRWKRRRRMLTSVIVFCMVIIGYIVLGNGDCVVNTVTGLCTVTKDSRLDETLAMGAFGLLGTSVITYVSGVVADDKFQKDKETIV